MSHTIDRSPSSEALTTPAMMLAGAASHVDLSHVPRVKAENCALNLPEQNITVPPSGLVRQTLHDGRWLGYVCVCVRVCVCMYVRMCIYYVA